MTGVGVIERQPDRQLCATLKTDRFVKDKEGRLVLPDLAVDRPAADRVIVD